ncbi:MAG: trehalose-phosphatase [Pseudolabrys sp.]
MSAAVSANATKNDAATAAFLKLDVTQIALLLDFDGTLVDIAATPDAVHVSDDLCESLARLLEKTDGALAIVSGRPIADIDSKFAPLKLPVVGGHGAEMRIHDDEIVSAVTSLPDELRRRLKAAEDFDPGVLIEDKGYSVALHYRRAPVMEGRLRAHIEAVCAGFPGEPMEMLPGKALFEIKRPGVSKGEGVRALLTHAPFAGRTPVFIGDDETDKTLFALLPEFGGVGFSVDLAYDGLVGVFASPAAVCDALKRLAFR